MSIKVTVWNEFVHEKHNERVKEVYPDGIHNAIAEYLKTQEDMIVRTATLDDEEQGLSNELLDDTDVLIWWGHAAHNKVKDEYVERVYERVMKGMGFIALHSAHFSKPFKRLMGTTCGLRWREIGDNERLWVIEPTHPIAQGLGECVEIPADEMYGERFDIPVPDELVFIGWFKGGDVFRSGCCYRRGYGKVFYFQPGHETYPVYYQDEIRLIIGNAVRWARPVMKRELLGGIHVPTPIEKI
jgi:trehalose utilization protein